MDIKKKGLLQQHQKDVVRDLDIVYIIDELFANEAISNEDFDHVFTLNSRADRTRYLIDTLIQNGNNHSFEVFVDSLQKDHRWLWEKFTLENMKNPDFNDSFEDSLSRGDVPRLPDHYVPRMKVEQEVAAKLRLLSRHKILTLHGMSGSGKTCVAIAALRNNPELITNNFNGVVFWLNLGNVKSDDDVFMQQNKLHRKVSSIYTHRDSTFMNSSISMSSIGSNNDSHSLASYEWCRQDLKDTLKSVFSEPALKDCLLVIDEVNEKRCVDAFDIGCKLLVTTRDTDVVANFHPQIVKIENNFEEKESLQLLASCLDIDVSQLPRQARKLNEICKGSPFHIALLGAQLSENKERLIHDTSHWNFYINKLAKKDFFFSLSRHSDNPMKTIEICINSLKPLILPLFKMLAILPDNVKVPAKVLSKLWDKPITDVEVIMKQLRSKSLIIESYNQELRNYSYEVHDLIMNYLRTCLSDDETKKLHIEFLNSYNYDTLSSSPVELVDDGYMAFYIGHHILHTGDMQNKWSLFKLYLNLKFLGNKVRLTGPADAITDFQKYEQYIARGLHSEIDRELLLHIKAYLSTHGNDLYRYPCTDIVQSILQHESKGILYSKACEIAQENCDKNELYFELLHEQNVDEVKHSTIDVKENVTCVCFLGDYVLVGTTTGVIKVFHIPTNKLKKDLPSSGDPIKWMAKCPSDALLVAALTGDGVVKIWYMDELDHDLSDSNTIDEEEDESVLYDHTPPAPVTIYPKLGPFINCRWANNEEMIITHTTKMIMLYAVDGTVQKVLDSFERDKEIITCIPSNDDRHLIAVTVINSAHYVDVFDMRTREKLMTFEESIPIVNILNVPGSNRLLVLNDREVLEHQFKIHAYSPMSYNTFTSKKIISSNDIKENLLFISSIVNKSGTLLFISTNDSRVICIDLKTNTYVFDLDNRRGNVVSMGVSEVWYDDFVPGSDVLLTGTGSVEHSVKVWYLDAAYVEMTTRKHRKVRLTTNFDVSFLSSISPVTPSGQATPPSDQQSLSSTPKRHQSFITYNEVEKKRTAKKTMSLDRHSLKPLNLKGICNGNEECGSLPLLAVVDDKNNIQIIRGRKVLTEITSTSDDKITTVKLSPCNQYVIYGLQSGLVKKYMLRSKETKIITDVASTVQYLSFVKPTLLVVAGRNKCLMAYWLASDGEWKLEMLQKGSMNLGSQEILNDIQGNKKKNGQSDTVSQAGSEDSAVSKERLFPHGDRPRLSAGSGLVRCFCAPSTGIITVENNATVKLWSSEMKLVCVLNGRQTDVFVNCAAFQKNVLVICDDYGKFQIFQVRETDTGTALRTQHENKVNYKIVSCDLTADGHVLAMGLDSGDVVIWNVPGKCQLYFLRHHKSKVQTCFFSPVPDKLYRSNSTAQSPVVGQQLMNYSSNSSSSVDEQPPLVLVTMATEIVWWNVTYLMRMRSQNRNSWRTRVNVLTPLASPLDNRNDISTALDNLSLNKPNYFFGEGNMNAHDCWEKVWKNKSCKEGSKRKEILACIKLSGMNAKKLCHDDNFCCFVTVDNPGHIHIMNVMKPNCS